MSQLPETLTALLNQQQSHLDALLLLLSNELAALTQRDAVQLDLLVQKKSELLHQITELDHTLATHAELPQLKTHDEFKQKVSELETTLAACKEQTLVNQQIAEHSQVTLQRLKNELLGARGKSGLTYTSKGQPAVESKGPGIKA